MKNRILLLTKWAIAPFALCAVCAAVHAASLNLKPGAWEMSITTVTTGNILSPAVLEKLPEAQRAQLEQQMRERSGKPSIQLHKTCISQKDIDELNLINAEDENCARKIHTQSSTRVEFEESCSGADANRKSINIESKSPGNLSLIANIERDNGSKIHLDVNGRWLGADCKGIPTEAE